MLTRLKLIAWLSLFSVSLIAQQNIKGTVLDKQSEMPLIGATIQVLGIEATIGTVTDIDGAFILENVPIGRNTIAISYLGYQSMTVPNIYLTAGKEAYLEIKLEENIEQLSEVVVTAEVQKDKAQNELATVSARTFSVEEVNRYSGGRSDVARLAANFAGVSTADDARNDIVIRGNSPTGVLWRVEGIPIPNPNHFSATGTTGGPVSALNPNMIKNSDFMTSAFPAEYGNALAGVFDLGFRTGNKDKHEFTAQVAAVTGFEGMAEGPINKEQRSSYLVAARYSFLGLATELGLPIGTNATPNYRDIAFNVQMGKTSIGQVSFFGIAGSSDIDFLHDEVDEQDLFAATDEDLFVRSNFGVLGLKHNLILDQNTYWRTIIAGSTSSTTIDQNRFFNLDQGDETSTLIGEIDNTETRLTISSFVNRKFSARLTARAGVLFEQFNYDLANRTREFTPDWLTTYAFDDNTGLWQAFVQTQYKLDKAFTLNLGLHTQLLTLNDDFALEPRVALNYRFLNGQTLSLGYGIHSQVAPLPILLAQEEVSPGELMETNRNLAATRSQHFVLAYDLKLGQDWRLKAEAYYQYIDKVPVEPFPTSFSLLNEGADFGFSDDRFSLVNEGTGTNQGVELTLEKFFSKGYYSLITLSLYDSQYKGSDGIERNTAFNNQYVANFLAGREIKIGKDKRNALTFDTKLTTAGGRYFTPVDLVASQAAGQEILMEDRAFSERFSPYFRLDVKFGMKLNSKRRKVSHQFYFDIQNVTDNQNVFARRYNRLTNEVNEVYQIGFFPDFMYRFQF